MLLVPEVGYDRGSVCHPFLNSGRSTGRQAQRTESELSMLPQYSVEVV